MRRIKYVEINVIIPYNSNQDKLEGSSRATETSKNSKVHMFEWMKIRFMVRFENQRDLPKPK